MAEEKKYSDNEIRDIYDDWGHDEQDPQGRPYGGQAIQNFIKRGLTELHETKVGGAKFEDGRLKLLDSEDGSVISSVEFGTTIYQLTLATESVSPIYVLTSATQSIISISPSTKSGAIGETLQPYIEDYEWNVAINTDGNGYVVKQSGSCRDGQSFSVNVRPWLVNGVSKVRFSVTGTDSGTTAMKVFDVQLTSMSLIPANVAWNNIFHQGEDYQFGSFSITGNLSKVVHIVVTSLDGSYRKEYSDEIGTRTYNTNYRFGKMEFPSTGVYNVDISVVGGSIESAHYTYQIMCVSRADRSTAKLVCMNEFADKVSNGSSYKMFEFATYNGGEPTSEPVYNITANYDGRKQTISGGTLTGVDTGVKQTFNWMVDVVTLDEEFDMTFAMEYGNTTSKDFLIDNKQSYQATSGAVFYMSAATRLNSQQNRDKVVNEADRNKAEYDMITEKVAFVNGMDGWTTDDEGRACLAVKAGSKATINYAPLSNISGAKSIEIIYKVKNVSTYDENVISIASNPADPRFIGLRIRPNEICLHSSVLLSEDNDADQNYKTNEEEVIHSVIVLANDYRGLERGGNAINVAQIYVNGSIKRIFESNARDFITNGGIVIGSDTADVYVYAIRVYNQALMYPDVHANYVASLIGNEVKEIEDTRNNEILNDEKEIDFDSIKGKYNYFVVEMTDGREFPNYSTWTKEDTGRGNLEMHFADHKEWDWKIWEIEVSGQGTTSMSYFRWNFRSRIDKSKAAVDKKLNVAYWNTDSDDWGEKKMSKDVKFDGSNHTPIIRITGKKNYASSAQSHKMGCTSAYNDLHDEVVGKNIAEGRTAVYQVPAYGFVKKINDETGEYYYEFIGLYTIGADKGDKPTFAYKSYTDTLITMEGVDHSPVLTMFKYPWNDKVIFKGESLSVALKNDSYQKGWEVGNCCDLETAGTDADDAKVLAKLVNEFKPAYDVAYLNSTYIKHESDIASINANPSTYRSGKYSEDNGRPLSHYELFDDSYNLWYYNIDTNKYEQSGVNVMTDLGVTDSELTGLDWREKELLFRDGRRKRFMKDAPSIWNIDDCVFCHVFLTIFGATDNHGKNSYPYRFTASDGWRWRQDDLDTIFDIDNFGKSSKKYSVEFKDFTDDTKSAYVFKGEDSAFWTLIDECYGTYDYGDNRAQRIGHSIIDAMVKLGGLANGNVFERAMAFFYKYFWNKAQDYFTKSAYDCDSRYSYEEAAKFFNTNGENSYNVDVHPFEQALGNHYEAERIWVERRLIYVMSKYGYGAFEKYTDSYLGLISFRMQAAHDFTLTPAIDMYPAIMEGQNQPKQGDRCLDGDSYTFVGITASNGNVYIAAADYIKDIGDFSKVPVDSQNATLNISAKRLERLLIGSRTEQINGFKSVDVTGCVSLMTFDATNDVNLNGRVDFSTCDRIREIYLKGTQVTEVVLPDGCKVETMELSAYNSSLVLNNLKYLENLDISQCKDKITTISISACDSINAFELLREVWNTPNNTLRDIRITDVDVVANNAVAEMLYKIANGKNYRGEDVIYNGIDNSGNIVEGKPYISGTITIGSIMGGYYTALKEAFPNLEIKYTDIVYPSAEELGLTMNGIEFETMYEDDLQLRTFTTSAKKEEYRQVNWLVEPSVLPNGITITYTNVSVSIDFRGYEPSDDNISSVKSIVIQAESKWNNRIKITRNIDISSVKLIGLSIKADVDSSKRGESINFEKVYNPSNSTKKSFTYYEVLNEDGSVNKTALSFDRDEASVVVGDYLILDVYARFSLDESIFGKIRVYLNDLLIIRQVQTEFSALLTYIYNTQKVSQYPDMLYAKEAAKVTTLYNRLQENTSLTDFKELKYFVLVNKLLDTEFMNCTVLESIDLSNIETIGVNAFYQDAKLKELGDCSKVKSIGRGAFYGTGFSSIDLPSLESLSTGVFQNSKIEYVTSLGKLTEFVDGSNSGTSYGMFYNCAELKSVVFPETLVKIGNRTFLNCPILEMNIDSDSITSIGGHSFRNSLNGGYLYCPNLETLGGCAFQSSGIEEVRSLGKITTIPEGNGGVNTNYGVFYNCGNLTKVILSETLVNIGSDAFRNCDLLTDINLSLPNVEKISARAFQYTPCNSVLNMPKLSSIGTQAFEHSGITKIESLGELVSIPNGNNGANSVYGVFSHNNNLQEVVLPETLTSIGNDAFRNCPSLEAVNFSGADCSIGLRAFLNCSALQVVGNYSNIKSVAEFAFDGCSSLESIDVSNATSIGQYAFRNCKSLAELDFSNVGQASINLNCMDGCASLKTVRFGKLTSTPSYTNENTSFPASLENVYFSDTLTKIGSYTFQNRTNLVHVDLPTSITTIEQAAFSGCSALVIDSLNLPNLTSLINSAFRLTKIRRIDNLGVISSFYSSTNQSGTFYNCKELTFVKVPSTVTTMGAYTFQGCSALSVVVMESAVPPTLSSNVFSSASTSFIIYVPDGVDENGDNIVEKYKNASGWSSYASRIKPISQYVE